MSTLGGATPKVGKKLMRQIGYLSGKKSQAPSGSYIKPLVQLAPALPDPRSAGPLGQRSGA